MIPENPVVGGTALMRQAIRSPNFVTGSTGWSINQDGSAEFNNVVIRNGQIVSGTALFYSGAPALGNLTESIASVGGTDSKGNVYLSGTASYAGGGTIASAIQGNVINFFTAPGPGGPWTQVAQIAPGSGDLVLSSNRNISIPGNQLVAAAGLQVSGGLSDSVFLSGASATQVILQVANTTTTTNAADIIQAIAAAGFTLQQIFFGGRVSGDTNNRISLDIDASGNPRLRMGTGAGAPDILVQRNALADLTLNPGRFVNVAAAVALNNMAAPTALAGSTLIYSDSSGKPAMLPPAGVVMQIPGARLASFPNITVTAAALTTFTSATVNGGDAEVGSVYEIECNFNGVWGSTAQTLQFEVLFGGVAGVTLTLGNTWFAVSTAFRGKIRGRVICHTTGAAGTWSTEIEGELSANGVNLLPAIGAQATGAFTVSESTTTITVDSTVNELMSLQAAWGSVTGAPTMTSRVAVFKRVA